jgi:tRNA (mo5U34)-methyltransferase
VTQARNETITRQTEVLIENLRKLGYYHSIELPDGGVIPGLQTVEQMRQRLTYFPIPEDLRGKRVLDIGAWDGWFSFEMERRGADVVALDFVTTPQFLEAKKLIGSKVEAVNGDICKVSHKDLGYFDIVFFMGVLYHVKHPVQALENVCSMTKEVAFIESYTSDNGEDLTVMPTMEFYEGLDLRGQFDNWCGPNVACLLAMTRTAGFATAEFTGAVSNRSHVVARRQWTSAAGAGAAPRILAAENSVNRDKRFSIDDDDYVSIWFKGAPGLTFDTVFVEIGPYAARPVTLYSTGTDGWVAGCKLPPGLTPAWHDIRLRTPGTAFSNVVRIPVDVAGDDPAAPRSLGGESMPEIVVVTDGRDWSEWRVRVGADSCLSIWLRNAPDQWKAQDYKVHVNDRAFTPVFLAPNDERGLKQMNVLLPADLAPGRAALHVSRAGQNTATVEIELVSNA